jgi:hypothetical protein
LKVLLAFFVPMSNTATHLENTCKQKQYFTDKKGKAKTDGVHRAVRILDWLIFWLLGYRRVL